MGIGLTSTSGRRATLWPAHTNVGNYWPTTLDLEQFSFKRTHAVIGGHTGDSLVVNHRLSPCGEEDLISIYFTNQSPINQKTSRSGILRHDVLAKL